MNKLQNTLSPYLLQHADQPVNWYPWGDEAFELARRENKPVFLSIGYATCHWCHVMAHESFEDSHVAELLNAHFVCIKVDREEYPAVDNQYMAASHLMTGSGGWPLNVITTPDRIPFYAASYIPKISIPPRLGMIELIPRIAELWQHNKEELLETAGRISNALTAVSFASQSEALEPEIIDRTYQDLVKRYDDEHGGFDGAPKFPSPHNILFLLRYWRRTGIWFALEMVEDTLDAIQRGGIHDHIGGGFHRYATDTAWALPHFEKMLVDQAMLTLAFCEAYHATKHERFKEIVSSIISYTIRDLKAPNGGFYTAEDADSTAGEGRYYLWTEDEIRQLLNPEDAEFCIRIFAIEPEGNFIAEDTHRKTGLNVLHMPVSLDIIAEEYDISYESCKERLVSICNMLFAARSERERPLRDKKQLTDANGLMIAALAYAARVFGEPAWRETALKAADWITDTMFEENGTLNHSHFNGTTGITATIDDYQYLAWGFIELYELTFEPRYLATALSLVQNASMRFGDDEHGGYFMTSHDDTSLPVRRKDAYDGALPSGNSVAVFNLIRLSHLFGDPELESNAFKTCQAFAAQVNRSLSAHTMFLAGYGMLADTTSEVLIAGEQDADNTNTLIKALNDMYLPSTVILLIPQDENKSMISRLIDGLEEYSTTDGIACAYVCRNRTCMLPTTDPDEMLAMVLRLADDH